ncbi:MAG: hypothetical protein AAB374_00985 [Patescibacteria group bacterium]
MRIIEYRRTSTIDNSKINYATKIFIVKNIEVGTETVSGLSAVFLHNNKTDTKRSIMEIYRTLKPGGRLFIFGSFPNASNLQGLQGNIYLLFLRLIGKGAINGPVHYFSKKEIFAFLKHFSNVDITSLGLVTVPKRILIFPDWLNHWYQKNIFPYIHKELSKLFIASARKTFCAYFDVYAIK